MSGKFNIDDYVPVNERIEAFYKAFPEGSIQTEIVELTADRVTVKAYAFRTPDDAKPGVGHSSLSIPGATPYTRGSEIENAETSAWGRAIAALGFEVKRGIASSEEVRNKQPGQQRGGSPSSPGAAAPVPRPAEEQQALDELLSLVKSRAQLDLLADAVKVPEGRRATLGELRAMIKIASQPMGPEPSDWPKVGTKAYKALSDYDQAIARAWWERKEAADGD